jgi:hypothetical protein
VEHYTDICIKWDHFSSYAGSQRDEETTSAIVSKQVCFLLPLPLQAVNWCYSLSCHGCDLSCAMWVIWLDCFLIHCHKTRHITSLKWVASGLLERLRFELNSVCAWYSSLADYKPRSLKVLCAWFGSRNWCYHVLPQSPQEWQDSSLKQTKPASFKSITTQQLWSTNISSYSTLY